MVHYTNFVCEVGHLLALDTLLKQECVISSLFFLLEQVQCQICLGSLKIT